MGQAKKHMMDMEADISKGYIIPYDKDKHLCSDHFDNVYLREFINTHGQEGTCSYCSKKGNVCSFLKFIEHVAKRLTDYLGPIENEALPLVSSYFDDDEEEIPGITRLGLYAAPDNVETYASADELMYDFGLNTDNNELNDDISACFYVDKWIRRDPMGLREDDNLKYQWDNFCRIVKTKCRFTFFRDQEYYRSDIYSNDHIESDILSEVSNLVKRAETTLPVGTSLFRGRPEDDKAPFTKFSELTSPPASVAKENRMSPYGISMFYGSFDSSTPLKEIENYSEDGIKIYWAEFRTKKELKVIDLCSLPEADFWMGSTSEWLSASFLQRFHEEITKPIKKDDERLEYIPTQVFAEYLRHIQRSKDGTSYDGIIYKSSLTGKRNIVLFYDNAGSEKVLEMIGTVKIHEPKERLKNKVVKFMPPQV